MEQTEQSCDLGIAWVWQYDLEFIEIVEKAAQRAGLKTFRIERHNVFEFTEALKKHQVSLRVLFDRASDEDELFQPLARYVAQHRPDMGVINPLHLQAGAADKATMHLEFLSHGIDVPYTIIISPYNHKRELELSLSELANLGRPFIVKPANTTGGGIGVVLGAETLKDILEARQHHRNDKYLLQETVKPAYLSENRAWFRVIYAFGAIFPCWWDDQTHIYETVTLEEEEAFGLNELRDLTERIHTVCRLEFFSTEIVYTPQNKFVIVDYVNEICDMRVQSTHRDGVPDGIIREIAERLTGFVAKFAGVR